MSANAVSSQGTVQRFVEDSTIRWSCRRGDYVLWLATDSPFSGDLWKVQDFWRLQDGDYLTITNRWADLPSWLELHPLEVSGQAVSEMKKRLDAGYEPPDPVEGPNLWRVRTGERLVWVSVSSSERAVREILDLRTCALVIGESSAPPSIEIPSFGAPEGEGIPAKAIVACQAGVAAASRLGAPREFAPQWRFGR